MMPELINGNGLFMTGCIQRDRTFIVTTGVDASSLTAGQLEFRVLNNQFTLALGAVIAPPRTLVEGRDPGVHPHSVLLPDYVMAEVTTPRWLSVLIGLYKHAPTATIWPPASPEWDGGLQMLDTLIVRCQISWTVISFLH